MFHAMRTLCAALAAAFLVAAPAAASEDSMLVIDASGSMWGQIEGEAKIAIAKRVLADILKEVPAERRLGLIAYGHRRAGDCADIEELAPVGADRAVIGAAVQRLNPKGKTPMSDSVKLAAEKLRYTEQKATVVLVSDGIETCEPDPCGVAAALEAAGADLTVHVVGFDVPEENAQAQLRCIAENTGGTFVSAADAGELTAALQSTVVEAPQAAPETKIYLRATELEGGVLIEKGLVWTVTPSAGGDPVVREANAGLIDADIAPGTYDVTVERPADGLKGSAEGVTVIEGASKTVTIALTFPVEATIAVEPAEEGVAGEPVKVAWTGPARTGDFISVAKKDEPDGAYESYTYTQRGNPAEVRLPVEAGDYEIRYVLGRPYRVLARTDYRVTPATASLDAPETGVAGETVEVAFTGPKAGSSDYVTIAEPDAPDAKYMSYHYASRGSPAKIRLPLEAGDYEFRFVQAGSKVLARRAIKVTAAGAVLDAPATALAGETVTVAFTGPPAGSGDWITVVEPGAPDNKYTSYHYASRGSPGEVRMPLEAGDYELRYVQGGSKVLARRAITVTAAEASLDTKASAVAGETVEIAFTGPPAGSGDYITVTEPDAPEAKYLSYAYASRGSPAKVRMPLEAGAYELRFVQGNSKVIARRAIAVTAASATLDAPANAAAEAVISVAFTGPPAGSGDYVTIAEPDAPDTKYLSYAYSSRGSPVTLKMPASPGDYELRFVHGNKYVLARRPIRVTAP